MFLLLAATSLLFFLFLGAVIDRGRQQALESRMDEVLSPGAAENLAYLRHAVQSHQAGVGVARRAAERADVERLRRAVWVVEGFAPGMWEGLRAMWALSRTVDVIVALPPIRPWVWCAWTLRGLSGVASVLHFLLVLGRERTRLRVWVISRSFRLCLRWLKTAAAQEAPEWSSVRNTVNDLATVGDEAQATYERVIRSLDAAGEFLTEARARMLRA